jgi:hypothetical protein
VRSLEQRGLVTVERRNRGRVFVSARDHARGELTGADLYHARAESQPASATAGATPA